MLVELQTARSSEYPLVLSHATGSQGHWTGLQSLARDRGLVLSERRLERRGLAVEVGDEAGLYRGIGLPFVPPELREGDGEIEAALAGELPPDLVALGDVQGFVHCHTRYSDGRNTVEEMARAAEALGLSYITITDHSPSAHYAGGLTLDRLKQQWDEIARVQETVRIRLLRGTESDILADGSLDYPDAVLEQLDVVIASIHSRFRMDEDAMTRRLVRAMRLPCFKVWGHALGRLVERRPPLECRLEEVLDAAAESRVAIEVNGDPHRLDMAPPGLRKARARGIPFVISTDAHSVADLGYLRYGVDTARRGWVRRGEVLNALSADDFQRAVRPAG
jgi:DNA polymerase (family 10)